jgi:hypothetical protein
VASTAGWCCATKMRTLPVDSPSLDTAQAGGRPAWRVKVVTAQGEVRVIHIDVARVKDAIGLDAGDARRPRLTQAHVGSGAQR